MKKLILFLVLGVLLSCQSTDNRRLEKTLDLAQSNRGELEKVIQYYSQNEADSLKLKAALDYEYARTLFFYWQKL